MLHTKSMNGIPFVTHKNAAFICLFYGFGNAFFFRSDALQSVNNKKADICALNGPLCTDMGKLFYSMMFFVLPSYSCSVYKYIFGTTVGYQAIDAIASSSS